MEREVAMLREKLQQEQKIREQAAEEQHKKMELEKQKIAEESQKKYQTEQAEIERLRQIQDALFAAQEQKRQQKEIKKKKKFDALEVQRRERELEEQEALRVQDEIKRKIGDSSPTKTYYAQTQSFQQVEFFDERPQKAKAQIQKSSQIEEETHSTIMNTSVNTSIIRNKQVAVLGQMAELKREAHRKMMEDQENSLDEARSRLEREKEALQEAKERADAKTVVQQNNL